MKCFLFFLNLRLLCIKSVLLSNILFLSLILFIQNSPSQIISLSNSVTFSLITLKQIQSFSIKLFFSLNYFSNSIANLFSLKFCLSKILFSSNSLSQVLSIKFCLTFSLVNSVHLKFLSLKFSFSNYFSLKLFLS